MFPLSHNNGERNVTTIRSIRTQAIEWSIVLLAASAGTMLFVGMRWWAALWVWFAVIAAVAALGFVLREMKP
jgi:hypothetical protein